MKKVLESNFTTYCNHRTEPYFTFVKNGRKTIEGRLKKGLYCLVKPGDHIIVYNEEETDSIRVLVKDVRTYISIQEMFEHEIIKKLLPNANTIEEGIEIYQKFYTNEQQQKFGIVAIEFKRISRPTL